MSEIKPGTRIWIAARRLDNGTTAWNPREDDATISDHPALPKVAAWITEHSAEELRRYAAIAAAHYAGRIGTSFDDGLDEDRYNAATALVAALRQPADGEEGEA